MSEIGAVSRGKQRASAGETRAGKQRALLTTLLLLIPTLGAGLYLGARLISPARSESPPRTFTVERGDIVVKVTETGTVEPFRKVEVKSKVGGKVLRLLAAEGDRVQAGQVVAILDPVDQKLAVAQIEAQVAVARARLSQAQTETDHERQQVALGIADAEEQLQAARARLDQAISAARSQPAMTRAAVAQAEADLGAAQQSLKRSLEAEGPQELAEAQAAFEQSRAEVELADKALARQRELLKQGFVPQSAVDEAERRAISARARLNATETRRKTVADQVERNQREAEERVARATAALAAARANAVQDTLRQDDVKAARSGFESAQLALRRARERQAQVEVRKDNVEAARATVRQLESSLGEAQTRLRDTVLRAPISGVVTRRYLEEGELVTSGILTFSSGTPVMQIADLSRMQVWARVNEVDVAHLRNGQTVSIELDASRGEYLPGRVTRIAPASARAPGGVGLPDEAGGPGSPGPGTRGGIVKFEVRIDVLKNDPRLRPGMSANVDILTGERRGVLLLPLDAVDLERARVKRWVDQKEVETPVTLGLQNDRVVEIRSGLNEGDQVLLASYSGPPRQRIDLLR